MFSGAEQRAIEEKLRQLEKVKSRELPPKRLAGLITKRRIQWLDGHFEEMLAKYKHLPVLEQAYKIVFLEHMQINPKHSKIKKISPNTLRIESRNFCPYLEACKQLGLETKFVCREVGEPSVKEMLRRIHPNLKFSRDYNKIRPFSKYCEEYITLSK